MRQFNRLKSIFVALIGLTMSIPAHAKENTEAGLTLLDAPGARAAAMGEAIGLLGDDITAFAYNPASLNSLASSQASLLYQKGIADDASSRIMLGHPGEKMSLGLSLGMYDGGDVELFDGTTRKNVTAQKDLMVGIGAARRLGKMSVGLTGKYLSSELAETAKGSAFALDLGMSALIHPRAHAGFALQNFGSSLKYNSANNDLPRIARAGLSLDLGMDHPTSLLFDASYHLNTSELVPAIGAETRVGPLAFRAGYKGGSDLEDFTVGAGFYLGQFNVDYAFGLVSELDNRHSISVGFRFGPNASEKKLAQKPATQPVRLAKRTALSVDVVSNQNTLSSSAKSEPTRVASAKLVVEKAKYHVYTVRSGDTLAKISERVYGNAADWTKIYHMNRDQLNNPGDLAVNQTLKLPY